MNKDRILELADRIEKMPLLADVRRSNDSGIEVSAPEIFDMEHWRSRTDCGSIACVGGWATIMFGNPDKYYSDVASGELLGLDWSDAQMLFYPTQSTWYRIAPARAAAVLRNLAATGLVDWSIGA